jgi:hypothetical protein
MSLLLPISTKATQHLPDESKSKVNDTFSLLSSFISDLLLLLVQVSSAPEE